MTDQQGAGPDPETVVRYLSEHFPGVAVAAIPGAWFFSLDPVRHFPNFATVVTTDDFDQASDLAARGLFRLNIGVGKASFLRLVGDQADADYLAIDTFMPHPQYAAQRWISIINPSAASWTEQVMPLLDEAFAKLRKTTRR